MSQRNSQRRMALMDRILAITELPSRGGLLLIGLVLVLLITNGGAG